MSLQKKITALGREPDADARARRNSALLAEILRDVVDELESAGFITSAFSSTNPGVEQLRRESDDVSVLFASGGAHALAEELGRRISDLEVLVLAGSPDTRVELDDAFLWSAIGL